MLTQRSSCCPICGLSAGQTSALCSPLSARPAHPVEQGTNDTSFFPNASRWATYEDLALALHERTNATGVPVKYMLLDSYWCPCHDSPERCWCRSDAVSVLVAGRLPEQQRRRHAALVAYAPDLSSRTDLATRADRLPLAAAQPLLGVGLRLRHVSPHLLLVLPSIAEGRGRRWK